MGAADQPIESEVKYRLAGPADAAALRARLRELGAERVGEDRETNLLFDRADGGHSAADEVLRLRLYDGGPRATLTYKGPTSRDQGIKSRTELELALDDGPAMQAILAALGFLPTLSYEKVRETWHLPDGEVVLDRLSFGWFCEIEARIDRIPAIVAQLGLSDRPPELASYAALTAQHVAAARSSFGLEVTDRHAR